MLVILSTTLVIILSRLALVLAMLHFIWTFSEIHARIIALVWLTMSVNEYILRYALKKGEKNESN